MRTSCTLVKGAVLTAGMLFDQAVLAIQFAHAPSVILPAQPQIESFKDGRVEAVVQRLNKAVSERRLIYEGLAPAVIKYNVCQTERRPVSGSNLSCDRGAARKALELALRRRVKALNQMHASISPIDRQHAADIINNDEAEIKVLRSAPFG